MRRKTIRLNSAEQRDATMRLFQQKKPEAPRATRSRSYFFFRARYFLSLFNTPGPRNAMGAFLGSTDVTQAACLLCRFLNLGDMRAQLHRFP